MRRRGGRRGRQGNNGFLMLLLFQLFQRVQRLDRKPPVTLALMAFMIAIYLQPSFAPSISDTCLSPSNADPFRMIGSAFLHASDMHLYYNMSSLLWKGVQIELAAGSVIFTAMLSILLLLSHGLYIIVGNVVGDSLPFGGAGCVVGFSAVLFALKVVLNDGSSTHSSIFGISVPTQYAAWLELIVASVISPRASFLGHLCGILAGYLWVRGGVGQKVGEIVAGNGGNAQAWYNPIGFMQRTNPNGGFFNGMGNMFQGLFNGDQTVPQTGQQQPHHQQQNDMSTGFFSGLGGLFGGLFSGDQSVPEQQRGTTYGRGTTNPNTENEDAQMRAAMEQSRREYAQTQSNSREPTTSPPSVRQAEQARWEQEALNAAVGDETPLPGFRPNESDDITEARNKERATIRKRRMQRFGN